MYQFYPAAIMIALLGLTACSDLNMPGEPAGSQNARLPAKTLTIASDTSSLSGGYLAHITYRYDPHVLARAETEIPLPPDFTETAFAIKWIPRDLVSGLGSSECSFGSSDTMPQCTAESEIGFALALLDRPIDHYSTAIAREPRDLSTFEPARMHGAEGFSAYRTTANATTRYTFLPSRGRTILLIDRTNPAVDEATQALQQVRESIAF